MNARSIVTRAALSVVPALCVFACTANDNPVEPDPEPGSQPGLHIVALTSTTLTAVVNTAVQPTPSVAVRNYRGNPVSGVPVGFLPSAGGRVINKVAVTDENGIASPGQWTMSTFRGPQTLRVLVDQSTEVVLFTAEANPDVPAKLRSLWYDSGTGAISNDTMLVVAQLSDRFGNSVNTRGITVTFTVTDDNASLSPVNVMTDSSGQARFLWILGQAPVIYTLSVSGPDLTGFTRSLQVLDPESTNVYDLESIAGNPPRDRTIERGYVALNNDGSLLDVLTGMPGFELEGTTRSSGTYEKQGEHLILRLSTDYWNASVSGDNLLVQRWDPNTYVCCATWVYRKRDARSP